MPGTRSRARAGSRWKPPTGPSATGTARPGPRRVRPVRGDPGVGHRERHRARSAGQHLRALLHHQTLGSRHRAGAGHGPRHRPATPGGPPDGHRPRPGHHLPDPVPPSRGRGARGVLPDPETGAIPAMLASTHEASMRSACLALLPSCWWRARPPSPRPRRPPPSIRRWPPRRPPRAGARLSSGRRWRPPRLSPPIPLRNVGPMGQGGRVVALAVDDRAPQHWLAAFATGRPVVDGDRRRHLDTPLRPGPRHRPG